jgi:hypothetical protein
MMKLHHDVQVVLGLYMWCYKEFLFHLVQLQLKQLSLQLIQKIEVLLQLRHHRQHRTKNLKHHHHLSHHHQQLILVRK